MGILHNFLNLKDWELYISYLMSFLIWHCLSLKVLNISCFLWRNIIAMSNDMLEQWAMTMSFRRSRIMNFAYQCTLAGKDCFTDLYSEILASIFQTLFCILHTVVRNIFPPLMQYYQILGWEVVFFLWIYLWVATVQIWVKYTFI